MEYWTVDFWEKKNGVCYVEKDILDNLKTKDRLLLTRLFKRMAYCVSQPVNNLRSAGELEDLGDDILELKFHLPKAEIRFLGCLIDKYGTTTFYVLVGFRKKDRKIRNKYIKLAKKRLLEFKKEKNEL